MATRPQWRTLLSLTFLTFAMMSNVARAESIPIVTGEQWIHSSDEAKKAYLVGVANVLEIERAYYASSLADALERQGRYEDAWRVIQPHIDTWSANVISVAVSLLQRRGREQEANALGHRMIERYTSADTRIDFAAVLWREGRYKEAAELFDTSHARPSSTDWQWWVPDQFVDSFGDDATAAAAAFDPFTRIGLDPPLLETVPAKFLERNHPGTAFALTEQLNVLKLRYSLGDRWTIKTEVGQARGADLVYTIQK